MKVLVTGGAGIVGKYVVRELLQRGHEITVAGRTPGVVVEGAAYMSLDCVDYDAVRAAVGEHDTVIHLAAIPQPDKGASSQIFQINCQGTYNVYEACAEAGIQKLAVASSINALGMFYGCKPLPVRYFPIDEDHPQLCSDPYSFSKKVVEDTGEYFWHKNGISSVAIRIPWVKPNDDAKTWVEPYREKPPDTEFLVRNYWVWCDARDSARAFVLGIETPYEGYHTLFVNDSVNLMGMPTRELLAIGYPEVSDLRAPFTDCEALVSCRRAKDVLGWRPIYNTRRLAEAK